MDADSHIPYEALARYLSGSAEPDERESVERHLRDCEFCRKDRDDAKAWASNIAALPGAPAPPKFFWPPLLLGAILLSSLALFLWWRFA